MKTSITLFMAVSLCCRTPAGNITFCLDYATSGVGWTANGIQPAYRVYPEFCERTVTIKPLFK